MNAAREERFKKDVHLMDIDLVANQSLKKGVGIGLKTRLRRELGAKKLAKLPSVDSKMQRCASDSHSGPLSSYQSSHTTDPSFNFLKKWDKCPEFEEFYRYLVGDKEGPFTLPQIRPKRPVSSGSSSTDSEKTREDKKTVSDGNNVEAGGKSESATAENGDLESTGIDRKGGQGGKTGDESRESETQKHQLKKDPGKSQADPREDSNEKRSQRKVRKEKRGGGLHEEDDEQSNGKKLGSRFSTRPLKGRREESWEDLYDEEDDEQTSRKKGKKLSASKRKRLKGRHDESWEGLYDEEDEEHIFQKKGKKQAASKRKSLKGQYEESWEDLYNEDDEHMFQKKGKKLAASKRKSSKGRHEGSWEYTSRSKKGRHGKRWQKMYDKDDAYTFRRKGMGRLSMASAMFEQHQQQFFKLHAQTRIQASKARRKQNQQKWSFPDYDNRATPTASDLETLAPVGITPSGTHILSETREILLRDEALILSDMDPWHISVRFAFEAGGVCDSIGVRNDLLRRRKTIKRLIHESKLTLRIGVRERRGRSEGSSLDLEETGEKGGRKLKKKKKGPTRKHKDGMEEDASVDDSVEESYEIRGKGGDLSDYTFPKKGRRKKRKQDAFEDDSYDDSEESGGKGRHLARRQRRKGKDEMDPDLSEDDSYDEYKESGRKRGGLAKRRRQKGKGKKKRGVKGKMELDSSEDEDDSSDESEESGRRRGGLAKRRRQEGKKKRGAKGKMQVESSEDEDDSSDESEEGGRKRGGLAGDSDLKKHGKRKGKGKVRHEYGYDGSEEESVAGKGKRADGEGGGTGKMRRRGTEDLEDEELLMAEMEGEMSKGRGTIRFRRPKDRLLERMAARRRQRRGDCNEICEYISDSEIPEGIDEQDLFQLMQLNKRFNPRKLKSSYSFEKMFAHRPNSINNYAKLLAVFEKPFKQNKTKKPADRQSPQINRKEEIVAEKEEAEEPSAVEASPPPLVLGKLRDYKFLQHKNHIPETVHAGHHPRNKMSAEEIRQHLSLAMQVGQVHFLLKPPR